MGFLLGQDGLLIELLVFLYQSGPLLCLEEAAPEDLPALLGSVTFTTVSHCIQVSQRPVVDARFHYISFVGFFLLLF